MRHVLKSIDKFEQNSYEAVALFAVYICLQDGKLSDQEASELFMQSDVMKNFYFECYGEICDLDIEQVTFNLRNSLEKKKNFLEKKSSKEEIKFFNNIITDNKLRDLALLISKLAASKDGFHKLEENKWNFWFKNWLN